MKNGLLWKKLSTGICPWSIYYLLSLEWADNFIHEGGWSWAIYHFRWNKAKCEGTSCPKRYAPAPRDARWLTGILITAVKSECMDPLTELYWEGGGEEFYGSLLPLVKMLSRLLFKKWCWCHSRVREPQCCADKMNDSKLEKQGQTARVSGKDSSALAWRL